jgi:hypothetical protein
VFKNVSPNFTPEIGPGRFMRLTRGGTGYTGEGYADGGAPEAEYLQAQLAIESIWVDLEKYMKQVATAVNLPFTALEIEYGDAPSGISLVIKEWPLLKRAANRRRMYQMAETSLARTILTACGNHYGQPELVTQAQGLELVLAWAEPDIPVPGPDRDQSDEWEVAMGLTSRVAIAQQRYGLSEDRAIEHIKHQAELEDAVKQILPAKAVPGEMMETQEEKDLENDDSQEGQE